jgi:hypothetical protein
VHATTTRLAVPVMDIAPSPAWSGRSAAATRYCSATRWPWSARHTARGANNGIEQATGLVAALTQHRKYHADLGGALTGWQRRHLPAAVASVRLGPVIGGRLGLGIRQP